MILLETNPFLRKLPKLEHSITRRYVNQKKKKKTRIPKKSQKQISSSPRGEKRPDPNFRLSRTKEPRDKVEAAEKRGY